MASVFVRKRQGPYLDCRVVVEMLKIEVWDRHFCSSLLRGQVFSLRVWDEILVISGHASSSLRFVTFVRSTLRTTIGVVRARFCPHRFVCSPKPMFYSCMSRNAELCGRRVLPVDVFLFATSFQLVQQKQFCLSQTWICPSCKLLTSFVSAVCLHCKDTARCLSR